MEPLPGSTSEMSSPAEKFRLLLAGFTVLTLAPSMVAFQPVLTWVFNVLISELNLIFWVFTRVISVWAWAMVELFFVRASAMSVIRRFVE